VIEELLRAANVEQPFDRVPAGNSADRQDAARSPWRYRKTGRPDSAREVPGWEASASRPPTVLAGERQVLAFRSAPEPSR